MKTYRTALLIALLLSGLVAAAEVSAADPQLVDRIVAIVDEEMILQSDLEREIEAYRYESQLRGEEVPAESSELRREVLERLIESKLIIAAAKAEDMVVEDQAIQTSVDEKIDQWIDHFGSREAFASELSRANMSMEDYRNRLYTQIRDQQYLGLVIGRFIKPEVEVLENEVEEYYYAHLAEMPQEPDSLTISNILIPVQPSEDVRAEVQRKVAQVQAALADGQSFADVAVAYSEGPNATRGGVIGVVAKGDLFDPSVDQAVFALAVGEVSQPVVSSRGVHILRVDALKEGNRRALSQIYFPLDVTREDVNRAQEEIEAARARVMAGEAFSLVAEEVSGDLTSARNGGLLGTFPLEDLSAQFQEALADVQEGDVTEPLMTPVGWYIFLVNERVAGHMYTYEELKEQIRRAIEAEKMEKVLSEYVLELRTRFFIDQKS